MVWLRADHHDAPSTTEDSSIVDAWLYTSPQSHHSAHLPKVQCIVCGHFNIVNKYHNTKNEG